MLAVNIGDYGILRRVIQKRAVPLVRLNYQIRSPAAPKIRSAKLAQLHADNDRRVKIPFFKHKRHQCRSRAFAVRAGYRNGLVCFGEFS